MRKRTIATLLIALLTLNVMYAKGETASDRLTVSVRGTGPDVVLIPGLASSSAVWDATVKQLEGKCRLHIVQVAGFAGSPARANAEGPIIQPVVDALNDYIKTNRLKVPKLIGHSLGGLMGLMLAAQHPENVGKLLIVDALPFFPVIFGANNASDAAPQAATMRDTILKETQDAYAEGQKAFLPMLVKSPEGLKAAIAWAIASDKSVVARAMYEDMTIDMRPKLAGIKTPITMLYPWDSASTYPKEDVDNLYQANYAALPHKTLVRIDDSRHFIMLDQSEKFATQVDIFLK